MAKSKKPEKFSLADIDKIKTPKQALAFIQDYLKVFDRDAPTMPHEERMRIIKSNIGYCAGYYDRRIATRIMKVFDTQHPVFGKTFPSQKEAFEMGVKMGEEMKKQKGT